MTRALLLFLAFAVSLVGCAGGKGGDDTAARVPLDRDGDGYSVGVDCDDDNPAAHPGADERCDGVDNDCNEEIDERWAVDAPTWFLDADGDGAGDPRVTEVACAAPAGFVAAGTDCDDTDPAIAPGAVERCDGVDNDCDGRTDLGAVDAPTWSFDEDGDGVAGAVTLAACVAPVGAAPHDASALVDCDDADPRRFPGATEVCNGADDDCDGVVDGPVAADAIEVFPDGDGDGQGASGPSMRVCAPSAGWVADARDCDDADPAVRVGATERCDGIDNDCDGLTDGPDAVDPTLFYADADGDGYTAAGAAPVAACVAPAGTRAAVPGRPSDCDDADAAVFPGAPERCGTGADEDCDGAVDEDDAVDTPTWYSDADGDGFGAPAVSTRACVAPARHVAAGTDCDDTRAHVAPGAAEVCDGLDNDCDPSTDEDDVDGRVWFFDADGDGFGAASAFDVQACSAPVGYTDTPTDCDDFDPTVAPDAPELCDGLDNDCDGGADNDAVDAQVFYADVDGDTFGDPLSPALACAAPTGTVANRADCDDGDPARRPDAVEVCDGVDNDCDAIADDGDPSLDPSAGAVVWYVDDDGDGFGDPDASGRACAVLPTGTVADNTDCDDAEAAVYPGAVEACDDVDNDCNLLVDDTVEGAPGALTLFRDADGDGFGDDGSRSTACPGDFPADAVSVGTDCDDGDPATYPGAPESCNAADDDCDGLIDVDDPDFPLTAVVDAFSDDDGDGFGDATSPRRVCVLRAGFAVANDEDCDDARATVNPAASEVCDSVDNDCNGFVDTLDPGLVATAAAPLYPRFADGDGDGFGPTGGTATNRCQATEAGFSAVATDCDDDDDSIYPGAPEACDGVDANCDGNLPPPAGVSFRDGSGMTALALTSNVTTAGEILVCPGTHTVKFETSAAISIRSWNPAEADGEVLPTSADYLCPEAFILAGNSAGDPALLHSPSTSSETLDVTGITFRATSSDTRRLVTAIGGSSFVSSARFTDVRFEAAPGVQRPGLLAKDIELIVEGGEFLGLESGADDGGGISCELCSGRISASTFEGNVARDASVATTLRGGAVYLFEPSDFLINDGSTFFDNAAEGGGAIGVEGDGSTSVELTLDGITVEENVADGDGGGIFLAQVFVEVDDIIVAGNGARNGGGIHCVQCGGAVSTSTLRDNTATADGAGLYVESLTGLSPFDFTDVDVEGNVATDQGGGVYVQGLISRPVSFRRSSFVSNEALDGGAAYVSAVGVLRLDESVVQRNVATQGPAVYIGRPPTTLISQFTATNVDFGVRSGGTNNRQRGTGADVDRHVEVPQASTPLMLDYVGVVPFTGCISTCSVPFTCPIVTQCF